MENQNELTAHEMLKMHEIISNENLGIKKSESIISMVKDQELVSFIQNSVATRRQKLKVFQDLVFSKNLQ
ncbi:hypothetical protein Desor_2845 [Desulfosporosinus orientis DSM 765]|uniref:Uncharacterized protein n=1 Tax=Desulfosporosinus orientis (strain ATCC 19365 / DSM 765 / NCIMB 8382 / VKM B-1628 / Singapore I) TaxID=768706 RepID=G7WDQ2_DESOD|nr:hypothetical protein [Desulfosporosinus orientis]AET68377.1 hypothetical protein Desor_2845 [Desulfosporosinus orientis DSM 765]